MKKLVRAICLLLPGVLSTSAQPEPEGLLVYHEPAASYAEAVEYQSFRQENALYSSVVTTNGHRKKLKAGAVVALLPYPPSTFDATFSERAQTALHEIEQVEATYPQVKSQLRIASGKWTRAVAVFWQNQGIPKAAPAPTTARVADLPLGAQLISATADSATITHASGVTTLPLSTLSPRQLLALNATSRTIQLPLGIARRAASAPLPAVSPLTQKIERTGRQAIAFLSSKLGIPDNTLSVWTFFIVLPAAVVGLLITILFTSRRGQRVTA